MLSDDDGDAVPKTVTLDDFCTSLNQRPFSNQKGMMPHLTDRKAQRKLVHSTRRFVCHRHHVHRDVVVNRAMACSYRCGEWHILTWPGLPSWHHTAFTYHDY
jgi:hypothetical protein